MRVSGLWRYPVKSVGGEAITAADVGAFGVAGDRFLAVRDEHDEITWAGAVPGLMRTRATALGDGVAELTLPDGGTVRTDAGDVDARLSDAVGAKVGLAAHQPDNPVAVLHVLTTASLRTLAAALPDSAIDVTRFRPNLLIDGVPDGVLHGGYPEHGWLGRRLAVGDAVVRFTEGCDRCVVITKATPTVPHDKAVLRWVARTLGNTLGVYAAVETPGRIEVGAEARWLD